MPSMPMPLDFVGPQIRFRGQSILEDARLGHLGHGAHEFVVPVEDGDSATVCVRKGANQLGFCLGDALDGAEAAEMDGADIGDDADFRPRQPAQRCNLADVIHCHFQHGVFVGRVHLQQGERQALFAVEVALVVERAPALRED